MFRSPKLNKTIGGSKTSQHMRGEAIDIDDDFGGITNAEMFHFIAKKLDFDQLIWEFGNGTNPGWVHCSYVSTMRNRNKITIAFYVSGRQKYKHFQSIESFNNFKNALYDELPF